MVLFKGPKHKGPPPPLRPLRGPKAQAAKARVRVAVKASPKVRVTVSKAKAAFTPAARAPVPKAPAAKARAAGYGQAPVPKAPVPKAPVQRLARCKGKAEPAKRLDGGGKERQRMLKARELVQECTLLEWMQPLLDQGRLECEAVWPSNVAVLELGGEHTHPYCMACTSWVWGPEHFEDTHQKRCDWDDQTFATSFLLGLILLDRVKDSRHLWGKDKLKQMGIDLWPIAKMAFEVRTLPDCLQNLHACCVPGCELGRNRKEGWPFCCHKCSVTSGKEHGDLCCGERDAPSEAHAEEEGSPKEWEHADEEHAAEEERPQVWERAESPNELGEEEEADWSGQGDEDEDDGGREQVTHEIRSFQFHGAPWHSHKKQKRH